MNEWIAAEPRFLSLDKWAVGVVGVHNDKSVMTMSVNAMVGVKHARLKVVLTFCFFSVMNNDDLTFMNFPCSAFTLRIRRKRAPNSLPFKNLT